MRRFLVICEVLCISGIIAGCDVGGDRLSEPLDAAVQSLSTPTPSVGIIPATGWAPDGAPTVHTCNGDGTVSFHSGVWVVPIAATPGQSLSEVTFTIEAPTGHTGDPTTVIVELFSSQSASVLGQISLTPFGSGVRVNGDIPLSPARVVASGETFRLVFVPLAGGDYATNDTKIDAVRIQSSATVTASMYVTLSAGNNPNPQASDRINLITTSGFPFVNGISGGKDGRSVNIVLTSMSTISGQVVFSRLDGSSPPDDQLLLPFFNGEPELTMDRQDESVTFVYDLSVRKWRMISKNF